MDANFVYGTKKTKPNYSCLKEGFRLLGNHCVAGTGWVAHYHWTSGVLELSFQCIPDAGPGESWVRFGCLPKASCTSLSSPQPLGEPQVIMGAI